MKWITLLGLFAFYLSGAQTDARSIMERSNTRIKSLRSVDLNILFNDRYFGQISADIIIAREKINPVFGKSKLRMTGIVITSEGSNPLSMAYDGSTFSYLNSEKNELVLVENATYTKIGRTGQLTYGMAIPPAYYEDYVFDSLLKNAEAFYMRKDTVIFNQPAYAIDVSQKIYNRISGETHLVTSTWYIDKASYLLLGRSGPGSYTFLKVRSVNNMYNAADFTLSGNQVTKQVSQPAKEVVFLDLNSQAPDWTLPSNKTAPITLSKLRGKVVMLDFWGTWCVPCLKSMPAVQWIYDHFKNRDVEVIGVSVEMENAVDVPGYINRKGYTYPIALDGKTIAGDYKVTQYPTIYIIDKKGKIIFAGAGEELEKKKDGIIQIIQKALLTN